MSCKGNQPHRYIQEVNTPRELVERCDICGDKKIYNKAEKGRIDNKEYVKDHVREFAQPTGPTAKVFEQLYGKPEDLRKKGSNEE